MKKYLILTILAFTTGFASSQDSEKPEIQWLTFEEATELHKTNPKMWVVDISTSWCGWCRKMEQTTFVDSLIVEHINKNFYAVALDGEHKGDITVDGTTFKFVENGRRGYHELPAQLMGGKMSYPTVVFLGTERQNLSAVPGYKDRREFLKILEFFETYHPIDNPITWTDFVEVYKSPYPEETPAPVTPPEGH